METELQICCSRAAEITVDTLRFSKAVNKSHSLLHSSPLQSVKGSSDHSTNTSLSYVVLLPPCLHPLSSLLFFSEPPVRALWFKYSSLDNQTLLLVNLTFISKII